MYGIANSGVETSGADYPGSENIADAALRLTGMALSSHAEKDRRADGGHRDLHCSQNGIVISRKMQGIAMQLAIPARSYTGVVLSLYTGANGLPFYRISMAHPDPDLAIVLFEARDDRDIIAVWKAWAKYFALPAIVERQSGELIGGELRIGATAMGSRPLWRRRGTSLSKRKPQLLIRRRNAHIALKKFPAASFAMAAQDI